MTVSTDANMLLASRLRRAQTITSLHFKISDRCNHTCIHCYEVQGEKGELTTDAAKTVLERAAEAGAFLLTIGGGEATLRKDLLDLIAYARQLGFAVTLFTNAFLINATLAQQIAALSVWQVHVSIYGATAATHDSITQVPGSFERTLQGVRWLRAENVHVMLKMPLMKTNFHELDTLKAIASNLGCSLVASTDMLAREDGNVTPVQLDLESTQLESFMHTQGTTYEYSPKHLALTRSSSMCSVGRGSMMVQSNGEMRPCSMLNVALGNVLHDEVSSIANNNDYKFLGSITVNKLHGCRDCELSPGCSRCLGSAAIEAGDAMGPYLSACERAIARYSASIGQAVEIVASDNTEPNRPLKLGPFRIEKKGQLRVIPDILTHEDEQIFKLFPWLKPTREWLSERMQASTPESLVQLRRKQ